MVVNDSPYGAALGIDGNVQFLNVVPFTMGDTVYVIRFKDFERDNDFSLLLREDKVDETVYRRWASIFRGIFYTSSEGICGFKEMNNGDNSRYESKDLPAFLNKGNIILGLNVVK
jgi:hypothetical protein